MNAVSSSEDQFADIRPFHDDEIDEVIEKIINDPEAIRSIVAIKFPNVPAAIVAMMAPIIRWVLRRQAKTCHTVFDFQTKVGHYMAHMIEEKTQGFSVSGLDELPDEEAYLFVGNHRDIALDPAFVNYALYERGRNTVRIAIGDNLLTQDFATRLMRMNKSFIVNRTERSPKKLLANLKKLSQYIAHSIQEDNHSIWIAQREGRAKDGLDKTDNAIIKMFAIAGRKQDFSEYMQGLNIVPLAVSYEYDPCAQMKAQELYAVDTHGSYQKAEQEDIKSIATGITGYKGHVHLSVGGSMPKGMQAPEDVARWLDEEIIRSYVLFASNYFAYECLHGYFPEGVFGADATVFKAESLIKEKAYFDAYIASFDDSLRPYILSSYANPIVSKQTFGFMPEAK